LDVVRLVNTSIGTPSLWLAAERSVRWLTESERFPDVKLPQAARDEPPAILPEPSYVRMGRIMDLSSLAELGKVAGVAGVAIGLIALLAPKFIKGASSLPRAEQAPMFRLVAIGAFAIGALGIIAWVIAGVQLGTRVTTGNCGIATSGTATSNSVNCGSPLLRSRSSHDAPVA